MCWVGDLRLDVNPKCRVQLGMMARPALPILRAPPPAKPDAFSKFDPALFERVLNEGVSPDHMERSAVVVERMRALRVGGDFWRDEGWERLIPVSQMARGTGEMLAAALISATTYRDPFNGQPITAEAYVEQLGFWRAAMDGARDIACCVGMAAWKRERIADFFRVGDRLPAFRRSARSAIRVAKARGGGIAVWSTRMPAGLERLAAAASVPLVRVEDGFVRSQGLGSGMLPPASIIMDSAGIYYDPTGPSDLERILAETEFDAPTLARARRLIDLLVSRDITKYAAGHAPSTLPPRDGRRRILVPGQVADDLSVRLGGAEVRDNFDLLTRVRAANREAFIVYRPHPDVDAGHRQGAIPDTVAREQADVVQRGGSMAGLIGDVDEVHTLTSLAGFEALLRGKHVVTHGLPFYAGWGLTDDKAAGRAVVLRRSTKVTIEALVAGTLLVYSYYIDPVTRLRCGPEVLIERLTDRSVWQPSMLMRGRRVQGWLRGKLVRLVQSRGADGRR